MQRIYQEVIKRHLEEFQQMVFLSGPRQAGKTTIARNVVEDYNGLYLNWDLVEDRDKILSSPQELLNNLNLQVASSKEPLIIFDEIHKYTDWKNYLKGLYDYTQWHRKVPMIVTGSARLDIYKKGSDSLMGRYFPYRIHPLSVREATTKSTDGQLEKAIQAPNKPDEELYEALWKFGGFPEPFIRQNARFHKQWMGLRFQQLFREDIRDLSAIREIDQMELLAYTLQQQTGQLVNYSSLAKKIRVADQTIRRWISILDAFFFCFTVPPWSRNIPRSLLKDPKIYLWDWSVIHDEGARFENFIASHLLKACHFWTDTGLGQYDLFFLRTKDGKEVDFLVTKDAQPCFLVEAKLGKTTTLSKNLTYFHEQLATQHAFQVVHDMPYIERSCFDYTSPTIVPAATFLSQLV
ncbi:MAG: ATP-binding protein [Bacteroidota bacterium]